MIVLVIFLGSPYATGRVARPTSPDLKGGRISAILDREAGGMSPMQKMEVSNAVGRLSERYGLDPLLIMAIIHVESRFKPSAVSQKGALGLMQVRPIVVRAVAEEMGIDVKQSTPLLIHHEFNLRVGVHYFSFLMKKFGGDLRKALMAYNRGPTIIARLYKNRAVPMGGYPGKVLQAYTDYSFLHRPTVAL